MWTEELKCTRVGETTYCTCGKTCILWHVSAIETAENTQQVRECLENEKLSW